MKTHKILIVEDEKPLLFALKKVFNDRDFITFEADDGKEGLDIALKEHPDIILLDILLPKMNGMEVLKKLRQDEWGKKVEVILLTNLGDTGSVADALTYGVHYYFVKTDIDINDVVKKVVALLAN